MATNPMIDRCKNCAKYAYGVDCSCTDGKTIYKREHYHDPYNGNAVEHFKAYMSGYYNPYSPYIPNYYPPYFLPHYDPLAYFFG